MARSLAKLLVTCLPTPAWPIVTFWQDQALPSDAMALEILPVTALLVAEPPMPTVTSPMFGWLWPAMVTGQRDGTHDHCAARRGGGASNALRPRPLSRRRMTRHR